MSRKKAKPQLPDTAPAGSETHPHFYPEQPLLKTITQFLEEMEVPFETPQLWTEDNGCERFKVKFDLPIDDTDFRIEIYGNETTRILLFYTISPLAVPRKKRLEIAELVTRANSGLIHGNFETDFATGELRHKMGLEFDGTPPNFSLLRYLLVSGWRMMKDYQPAFESVVIGECTPEQAEEQMRLRENDNTPE
jgi:hypothetical protein